VALTVSRDGRPHGAREASLLDSQTPATKKARSVFYAKFKDKGYRAVSTGCSRRDEAVRWCEKWIAEKATARAEDVTLRAYAADFWSVDGHYARSRVAHGFSCSRGFLDIAESNTRNHILPAWGDTRLRELSPGAIDAWIVRLRGEGVLAPTTINKLLLTLRVILGQAVADRRLDENPAVFVRPRLQQLRQELPRCVAIHSPPQGRHGQGGSTRDDPGENVQGNPTDGSSPICATRDPCC